MKCWFCSIREAEVKNVLDLEMYGDVDATKVESETKVAYNVRHIAVPRCADCHSRHIRSLTSIIMTVVLALSAAAAALSAAYGWLDGWVWGLWLGLSLGLAAAGLLVHYFALKGIKSIRQAKTVFPEVKDLLEKCYKFGRRPRNLKTENDQSCAENEQQ